MIYNSSLFLLYFLPVFLIVYYLIDRRFKNLFLLLSGIFFYAWGAPVFVFYVIGAVLADFVILRRIPVSKPAMKRFLFWISMAINLGLLLYFKYMNFFVDQFNVMLGWFGSEPAKWTSIALPIGISFITFQKLSCTLDIYKGRYPGVLTLQDYALYVFMFPQLLSGPIVRIGQIAGQIRSREEQETVDNRLIGFYRFIIGLSKKVLIADVLAVTVNEIFALNPSELSSGIAWIGALAYTFQIYFDFSGYTDMAIGLALMLGFRLPENFNSPYVSTGITDFWKRWHITLSLWFRDYLFLPLAYAVSRRMKKDRYIGLRTDVILYGIAASVTFILCGFWHGAAWTFILWGAYQGLFLILDRMFLLKFFRKIRRIPAVIITFLIIVVGWVLFRSENLEQAWFYIGRMFSFTSAENEIWLNPKFWTMFALAAFFAFWGGFKHIEQWISRLYEKPGNATLISFSILGLLLFILSLATVTSSGFSPFIYFRF